MVLTPLFACAALAAAAAAGRVGEDGTGAMWIAPELVAASASIVTQCSLASPARPVDLHFEVLDPADIDVLAPSLPADNHAGVDFEWHPATGELTYQAGGGHAVFSDLALPSDDVWAAAASCGSH